MLLGLLLLHLLKGLVQQQGQIVEGRHHVLLVHGDFGRQAVAKAVQRLAHVSVDQSDFAVDRRRQLRDAHAQCKQAVLDHHSVVFERALGLAVTDVSRVLFVGELQFRHQQLLFEGQRQDVFQQRTQGLHVFALRFRFGVGLHLFHLLREFLHLFGGILLAFRGFLLLAFVKLLRTLFPWPLGWTALRLNGPSWGWGFPALGCLFPAA